MPFEPQHVVVSPAWVADRLDDVTVVDVRTERDFEAMGHLPGAANLPFERFRDPRSVAEGLLPDPEAFAALLGEAGITPDDTIVAYDEATGVYAARFLLTADVYGHQGSLHLLDGGYSRWQRTHPTSTELAERGTTTYRTSAPERTPVIDREAVEAAIDAETLLVDTRTPAEFEQAHIPGAVQLGWETLLDEDTHRLKPKPELEAILAERDIHSNRPVVLYCNTARRLSHTFAVLKHLGYDDVTFYEGSLTDWVRATAPAWDPVSLQADVRALASGGVEAVVNELGDDVFNRLKLIGLYHQRQPGYFMLRTKIPGGILTPEQTAVIGGVADVFARAPEAFGGSSQNPEFGDGFLDLTTRQDIQMHWIRLEDVPEIWDRYEAVGLTTLQACGNSVRNVVSCPTAGLDTDETIDVRPTVQRITERFLGDRTYANLPRKFKVSVTGCHENCARAHINDLGFTPAVKAGRDGFHVRIGGGLSDGPRIASDLDLFIEPAHVVGLVEAAADLFIEHGSYLDTAVNRLRFLVEELGIETVRDELEDRASFEFESAGESMTTRYRGDHVGVHEQSGGDHYVGLCVPTGRMLGQEFVELSSLARNYGGGEVRLTPNQNVLVSAVPADELDAFLTEPLVHRYRPDPGPFTRGIVTCTGSEFCNFGIIETKCRALRWARQLDAWAEEQAWDLPDVVRLHMSGCSASCAQPQLGDIGLRGETYRDEIEGMSEAVDIGFGGDLGREQFIEWVATEAPVSTVPFVVQGVVSMFGEERQDGEALADWLDRTPANALYDLATAPPEAS